jgi:2-keto-4-pentenoate hydratase
MATIELNRPAPLDDWIGATAERLRRAYGGAPIPPISGDRPELDLDTAYRVQAVNTEHWLAEGRRPVGAKIGLTARSVQQQLGVDQPDFGVLFADMSIDDGALVPAGRLLQPKVEAEIAFVLGRPIDTDRLTAAELIDAVDYALPAIEIVDSRIADWKIGIADTIADNASSGLFVLGTTPVLPGSFDLRLCGMVLELNGEPVSFGAGAACLGNPLHALGWLARTMAERGRPLDEGDIVLAGALGPMVAVTPGDWVEARIEGLGSVRVGFGRGEGRN